MSKRQSELHGNMQNKAETTLSPIKGTYRSKWDHLYEKFSVEEIRRLHYEENYTPQELERYTGIDRRALIQYYFYRYGTKPNKKFKGNPPEIYDKEWLVEQLQNGKTTVQIAKELGVSTAYVYKWCTEKHGINIMETKINKSLLKAIKPSYHREGENGNTWKGGRVVAKNNGYVYLYKPDHPNAKKSDGYVLEHRYVMSEFLGRPLEKYEIVHHKNGNKQDNRITNLEVRWRNDHPPLKDACCPNCGYELRFE